jgi:hypothetical protein
LRQAFCGVAYRPRRRTGFGFVTVRFPVRVDYARERTLMGLYFRKSVRMEPFRVNFSSSGVGLSAGIPGLRIGTGPRGNYIQMGAQGVYYRAALASQNGSPSSRPAPPALHRRPVGQDLSPPIPDATLGEFRAIESVAAEELRDSPSDAARPRDPIRDRRQSAGIQSAPTEVLTPKRATRETQRYL